MIEVGLVLLHDLAEMTLVEDEEEIQAFAPHTAQESLANGVGLAGFIRRGQDVDIGPLSDSVECRAVLVVVVANQEAATLTEGRRLP